MALAFRRAATAADEAMKGYYSHFKDYYGVFADPPITFDWDSAKAIAGDSPHNANNEVLPKSVTIANYIAGSPNQMATIISNIAYKADNQKELAFELQNKNWKSIMVHFDEKSTKKGENTWSIEVKDGVLHCTMSWEFTQYCGSNNIEDVSKLAWDWLDDHENLSFELLKKKLLDDQTGSRYENFTSDGVAYLESALPGKKIDLKVNWDEIAAVTGRTEFYSNQPPLRNSWILANALNDSARLMYVVHYALDVVLADDMGKEAFAESFDEVRVNVRPGAAHNASVRKDGKAVVFDFVVELKDNQNAGRHESYEYTKLGKAVEALL